MTSSCRVRRRNLRELWNVKHCDRDTLSALLVLCVDSPRWLVNSLHTVVVNISPGWLTFHATYCTTYVPRFNNLFGWHSRDPFSSSMVLVLWSVPLWCDFNGIVKPITLACVKNLSCQSPSFRQILLSWRLMWRYNAARTYYNTVNFSNILTTKRKPGVIITSLLRQYDVATSAVNRQQCTSHNEFFVER